MGIFIIFIVMGECQNLANYISKYVQFAVYKLYFNEACQNKKSSSLDEHQSIGVSASASVLPVNIQD